MARLDSFSCTAPRLPLGRPRRQLAVRLVQLPMETGLERSRFHLTERFVCALPRSWVARYWRHGYDSSLIDGQALDQQSLRSPQAAIFVRPQAANMAAQHPASPATPLLTGVRLIPVKALSWCSPISMSRNKTASR
jgi:hypothetical protein